MVSLTLDVSFYVERFALFPMSLSVWGNERTFTQGTCYGLFAGFPADERVGGIEGRREEC